MANKQGSPAIIAVWDAAKKVASPMTAAEIKAATELPMTTVHRATTSLANVGLFIRGACRNADDQRVASFLATGDRRVLVEKFGPKPPLHVRSPRSIAPMREDKTALSYFGAGVPRVSSVWALATL